MTGDRKPERRDQSAGSPPSGEPAFLVVGKLRGPHGLYGELLMEVITDFPERLKPGVRVFLGEEHKPEQIKSLRPHAKGALIAFAGYESPESAGSLRNRLVFVSTREIPALEAGEYYHHQLLGLRVISDTGEELGQVAEILTTSANDIYLVRRAGTADLLLPAIEPVVLNIDLEQQTMTVHLLPGL